jgi:hypothetical protein
MLLKTDHAGTRLFSVITPPPWVQLHTPSVVLGQSQLEFLTSLRATGSPAHATAVSGLSGDEISELFTTLDSFGLLLDTTSGGPSVGSRGGDSAEAAGSVPVGSPAEIESDHPLMLRAPLVWKIGCDRLERFDHAGGLVSELTPLELSFAESFRSPVTPHEGRQLATSNGIQMADADIDRLLGRLVSQGVLLDVVADSEVLVATETQASRLKATVGASMRLRAVLKKDHDRREVQRGSTVAPRIQVYGVLTNGSCPPLSIGMILAAASVWNDGALHEWYDFEPRWIDPNADDALLPTGPCVLLFSDYIWSHQNNLELTRRVKEYNPLALTVHGGPDCPSYPADAANYLETHRSIDVAVRGEGEATTPELLAALGPALAAGTIDLQPLAAVPGLVFRRGTEVVRTADRDRITDLNIVPSPFTTGLFDLFGQLPGLDLAIIETNRGCPYGCTFCDWGSATNSRIRKFDLERVFAEFEWCAKNEVARIFVADANFGIFKRDVEIAEHVAELKQEYGFPKRLITNYAKNTVKHLRQIVEIVSRAGILTEGLLSLQSMDEDTLAAIRRTNIKLEKYESLAAEFRNEGLPLYVDLMMGLPGQTTTSLSEDFQACIDREVIAKCHGTELLVNSPMNDPDYRVEHAIETSRDPGPLTLRADNDRPALVVSSTSFSRQDYHEMHRIRRAFLLGENLGVFRIVSRFVRHECGVREAELIERVRRDAEADPVRWPTLRLVTATIPDAMLEPGSWRFFVDELATWLTEVLGLESTSALRSILEVQLAVLPSTGRRFPDAVQLPHDVAAWHDAILEQKLLGNRDDWPAVVPPLASFGPATFAVDDPTGVCTRNLGQSTAIEAYNDWELRSDVSRPVSSHHSL